MANPSSSSSSSGLERELTCSICTDLFYDPITLLDCLHTHCGACAKSWFGQQHQNQHSFSCPLCRKPVRDARPNATVTNLLELFLLQNPDKKRSDEEIAELRRNFKPGDNVFPAGGTAVEENASSSPGNTGSSIRPALRRDVSLTPPEVTSERQNAITSLAEDMALLQFVSRNMPSPTSPSRNNTQSPRSLFPPLFESERPRQNTFGFNDLLASFDSPQPRILHPFPITPRSPTSPTAPATRSPATSPRSAFFSLAPRTPTTPSSPTFASPSSVVPPAFNISHTPLTVPNPPRKIADILLQSGGNSPIHITCDHCNAEIGNNVHHECVNCEMYHLCQRCARSGVSCPQRHPILPQKLVRRADTNRFQLQRGIFCSVCERHTDSDPTPSQLQNSESTHFWCCTICHDENQNGWTYCLPCVRQGRHCTHELKLWTNRRLARRPDQEMNALIIGGMGMSRRRGHVADGQSEYVRYETFSNSCDICGEDIPAQHSWLHCTICSNGDWDQCYNCYEASAGGDWDVFRCPANHEMMLLTALDGEPGTRKVITSPPHIVPEVFTNLGTEESEQKRAIAIKPFWPEECMNPNAAQSERKWGNEWMLGFPKGAEIRDVFKCSYIDGDQVRMICWGWYCGVGGTFDFSMVRFLDE